MRRISQSDLAQAVLRQQRETYREMGTRAQLAIAIEQQEKRRAELGIAPDDRIGMRKMDAPTGIKKVYEPIQSHQGQREMERRRRQLERLREKL